MKRSGKPRKQINRVSPRQRKRLAEYNATKTEWRERITVLFGGQIPCSWPGCTIEGGKHPHHRFGRAGSLLCDTRTWVPLCEYHHTMIHADAAFADSARAVGLLAPKGWWNRNPFEVTR